MQRRIHEEDAASLAADTSYLDNKRIKERVERKERETDKAVLLRLGHWRGWNMEVWLPKSQIEFTTEPGCPHVLIPVWLAKEKRIPFNIKMPVFD